MIDYLKKYDLLNQFEWVTLNNSGNTNPYHNNTHIERVTQFTIKGCEFYKIEYPYIRLAATAALFHDFNHSGGKLNDDGNITLAIQGYLEFNIEYSLFSEEESEIIIALIKETRFPHIKHSDDLTLIQNILRDSDTLQGFFHEDYINGVVKPIGMESGLSLDQMIKGQDKFLHSLDFGTEWASNKFNRIKTLIINKIKEYGSI